MDMNQEYAYIAGLFDGEGTVTITNQGHLRASLRNTHLVTLEWIRSIMGGNIYPDKGNGRKICYSLEYSSRRAEKFLEQLYPYLRIKKPQAILALLFKPIRYQRISTTEKQRRTDFYWKMRELNK